MTKADLKADGTIPVLKDSLKSADRKGAKSAMMAFRIYVGKGSYLSGSWRTALTTSLMLTGWKIGNDVIGATEEKEGGGASDVNSRTTATFSSNY